MSVITFFNASKQLFLCRNDVQAIDFLRKGSYAPVNSEAGNDEIENFQREDFYFVGITF